MNTTVSTAPLPSATTEDKTTAIVSYLTLIGFVVAVVLHGQKKTRLGAYHLRQMLGLMITSVALMIGGTILAFIPFVGWLISLTAWFGLFVLWITGLMAAANGEQKPVAVLGARFEQWFGRAFE
jgi:uncharacterized membrane protein